MDGPISANEAAGSAQHAAYVPIQGSAVGHPEKVASVSEGDRSRPSGRDEVGRCGKRDSEPAGRDCKAEQRLQEKTEEPACFVELRPPSGARQSAAVPSDKRHVAEAGVEEGQERLPGDPSQPARYDDLADSLEAVKKRWAEVNQEALEANALPGQGAEGEAEGNEETEEATARYSPSVPYPSRYDAPEANRDAIREPRFSSPTDMGSTTKPLNPSAPPGGPQDETVSIAVQRHLATRYQSFAMALSNPHQTRPIVDLFV